MRRPQVRGRPAADEERFHRAGRFESRNLLFQSKEIRFRQIIPPCHYGEVAIPAPMGAKGDVDVGGTRLALR